MAESALLPLLTVPGSSAPHFGTETITNSSHRRACTLCGPLQWAAVRAGTRVALAAQTPHPTKSVITSHVSQTREGRSRFMSKLAKLTLK